MKRRWAFRFCVFVVLGAIVNVAVAWGLYLWRPFPGFPFQGAPMSEAQRVWDRAWPTGTAFADDPKQRRYDPRGQFTASPAYRIIFIGHGSPQSGQTKWREGSAWEFEAGWPARSVIGHHRQLDNSNHGLWVIKGSWVPVRSRGSPIMDDYVPWKPFWPGFAINTVFYAVILWVIFVGPFALRRAVRRNYGHCAGCGYDLRGSGEGRACPECGATR